MLHMYEAMNIAKILWDQLSRTYQHLLLLI